MCATTIDIEEKKGCFIKLKLTVPPEDFQKIYQGEVFRLQKKTQIPGFRKGKVPLDIIQSRFRERIATDTFNAFFPGEFSRICEQEKFNPATYPRVEELNLKKGTPLTCRISFEVYPEFKLKKYKPLKVTKKVHPVTDKDIKKVTDDLRERFASFEDVNEIRPVTSTDHLTLDFEGFIDSMPIPDGAAKGYPVDMSREMFVPDFQNKLIGLLPGQEKEIEVTFPADYKSKTLAGKTTQFKVTVRKIRRKILPELNDEFAKKVGKFDTLEVMKNDIRGYMEKERKEITGEKLKQDILTALLESQDDFEIPETLVNERLRQRLLQFNDEVKNQGFKDIEIYLKRMNKTRDELVKDILPHAEKDVKVKLILSAIAEEKSIVVSEDEVNKSIEEMKRSNPGKEKKVDYQKHRSRIREGILHDKTINFLISTADIKEEKTVDES